MRAPRSVGAEESAAEDVARAPFPVAFVCHLLAEDAEVQLIAELVRHVHSVVGAPSAPCREEGNLRAEGVVVDALHYLLGSLLRDRYRRGRKIEVFLGMPFKKRLDVVTLHFDIHDKRQRHDESANERNEDETPAGKARAKR